MNTTVGLQLSNLSGTLHNVTDSQTDDSMMQIIRSYCVQQ